MKRTSLRAGLVGAALVACGLLAAPAAAGAAPATGSGIDSFGVSAAEAGAAIDYWTPERMRAATPADVLIGDAEVSAQRAEIESGASVTYPGAEAVGDAGVQESRSPAPGVGKVFFVQNGRGYVCSGNSVGAGNGSVVATAAHCVHGGGQGESYASKWIFVPSYQDGAAPFGLWAASTFSVPEPWSVSADISYDSGFVKVGTVDDRTLAEAVGAAPIAFNQARGLTYTAFGYPAAPPYDGETVQSCHGAAVPDEYYETQSQGIPCEMTGGSSGGPWLLATGAQNSVNSYGYASVLNVMFGPYYGTVAQAAYAAAAA